MSASHLFLKTDNAGKRQPTILTYVLIGAFVFGSCFFSRDQKPHTKKEVKDIIIKEKDIIEAANNPITNEGRAFKLDYTQVLPPPEIKQLPFAPKITPPPLAKPISHIQTKMIVFDNTNVYESNWVIPLGSMIKCLLIHNIVTNNFEAPVIAQVWEDFYFDGKLLLPFGTRIYGTASTGKERDRVTVKFHDIVFQDGKTIKIDAIGLSKDGSGGLTGTVIDDSTKNTLISMAMNLLSGMALGFQQTTTNELTGINQVEANSRNALLNGVANTFQKQAQQVQSDIQNSKGYAIVLAGSDLVVYFQKESDIQGG
ncbi:MAG: TrbI/VirB10 family protein [Candidatus Omnitrophica bacterium]|nr:TrbI/VirB10 family protein [Candidatus Omnitrophota bacterium]